MMMDVLVLGKNHYDMEGQRGANLVLLGEYEETNNKAGMSVSEASIDFDEHEKIKVFPAKYKAKVQLVSTKNRSGKSVTTLKLSDLSFLEEVEFVKKDNFKAK